MSKPLEPTHDCPLCPRLMAFRQEQRARHPDWFNAPVPCFGPRDAAIAIAGLAPGLQGANRTGRPFTGDWAGDLLFDTLLKLKLARGRYEERADDTLTLVNIRIVNSVRCVPPQNKPETSEINTCRRFLISELEHMPRLKVILALGKIAHDSVLRTYGKKISAHPFKHGGVYDMGPVTLISSYHCSRYNTNTGVLTTEMFEDVVGRAKKLAGK
ncbi:MAG: uracil-DNA glycosylase [Alphaproteobacteria bacterium 65-7]|nr:MAG: uracil-DNA glycosylase [Alphaproteobacteria bacterium 65-7]